MKKYLVLFSAALALFASCAKQSDLVKLEETINGLKSNEVAMLKNNLLEVKENVNILLRTENEMLGYIKQLQSKQGVLETSLGTLKSDLSGVESRLSSSISSAKSELDAEIRKLVAEDASLKKSIENLRSYSDSSFTATRDWTSDTFSTLEQYRAACAVIDSMCTHMATTDSLYDALKKDFDSTVLAFKDSLKDVHSDISACMSRIDKCEGDIEAAKRDITKAYTEAIATVQKDLDALGIRVKTCEDNIALLQQDLASRIQSLTFVPQYSDGKGTWMVKETGCGICFPITSEQTFHFEVQPSSIAPVVASSLSSLKMRYVSTITRAEPSDPSLQEMKIVGARIVNGLLAVTCSAEIPLDVASGKSSINISLAVSDGERQINSSFIELVMTKNKIIIFKDPVFKAACVKQYDKDGDGEVSVIEGDTVTDMDMSNADITSAEGVEMFRNLTSVNFAGNSNLKQLDLSYNKPMTSVNVSGCASLESLSLDESVLEHITCDFTVGRILTLNGRRGVICDITEGGYRKMLLLQVGYQYWDTSEYPAHTGAIFQNDGMSNTNLILSKSNTCDAAKWSRSFGSKWYLPAIGEIWNVYSNKSQIFQNVGEEVMKLVEWTASSNEFSTESYLKTSIILGSDYSTEYKLHRDNVWAMRLL